MKNLALLGLMLMSISTAVIADDCSQGSEATTASESDVAKAQASKDSEKADYRSQPSKSE